MNRFVSPRHLGFAVLVLGLVLGGCSKKAAEAPPATTPPPAEQPAATPPPDTTSQSTPTPSEATAISWQDAFFDYDKADLREDARTALDADARMLRDHADARVTIEGHCDERGTPEYNLALGERRASAARDYLVAAGIDGGRMDVISYGEERPFATGSNEEAWQQNRRAHLVTK